MELSHSLTLNEEALKQIPDAKKPLFIYEWLRFLNKIIGAANKSDIKGCQEKLVGQLMGQMSQCAGAPARQLVASALATLFSVGDTFLLFETINKCNDVLKNKDDSPSFLSTRLAAVACIGAMYERLGRMMGRSYEETVHILIKSLRSAESQLRVQIMVTLEKITAGMGTAASNVHKDIIKATKVGLTDRAMPVRRAAAMCLVELSKHAVLLYTTDLEHMCTLCMRALESCTSYDARCALTCLLGSLLATTQCPPKDVLRAIQSNSNKSAPRLVSLDEALALLASGFLRGGTSFLKGEIIKGSSGVTRELRVGVTQAYVTFVQELGSLWLEKNMASFLKHISEVISNPKASTSHVDAVYSRKCVSFILRSTLGRMLGEKAQTVACKEITAIITLHMNGVDVSNDSNDVNNGGSQHVLICMLLELGNLVLALSTSSSSTVLDPHLGMIDCVLSVLLHPNFAARLSAAWCLQCICVALPSQLHPLIARCCDKIDSLKASTEAIAGYSCAIAALVGCVSRTPLGIPHLRGKVVFNLAEELLRSASQNSRLSLHRTQAGWLIIGSVMTLGVAVVKGLLPRMLLLWKNSFPRSNKEIESEKARGDAFTWQVTLEGRAGALSSMHSFLLHCPELAGDDVIRRLLMPIESALLMLVSISSIVKQHGQQLKASTAMVRLRLYQVLTLLPPQSFEGHFSTVLKLLVSEFTLAESGANTSSSLLRFICASHHAPLLSPTLHHPDLNILEEQLYSNGAAGALEHDPTCLYKASSDTPHPLPLGVAVIDASVTLFGQMFPLVANKNRLKMLNLFIEMIRASKSLRQEAILTNILCALLIALKRLTDTKGSLGQEDVKKTTTALLMDGLSQTNPLLRCASGEAIGRMAQVVGDPHFVAALAQTSFDKLRSARDATSRTGHSLALGCLHRCVGGMGSSHHLSTSISILLALAKDFTAPVVQVWALHALSMIADSGGPMFSSYVEPALNLLLDLLLSCSSSEVQLCIGKCLQALITTIGPELQSSDSAVVNERWSLLCGCSLVQQHSDPFVQAEAVTCLQQMHMFAPRHVNLSSLVPMLVHKLFSKHLFLRRAAVSCLRQLAQREALEVCHHVLAMSANNASGTLESDKEQHQIPESGLPGLLFSLLDYENDPVLVSHAQHTLLFTLHALAPTHLRMWLTLCREVLTNAQDGAADSGLKDGLEPTADDEDLVEFHATIDPDPHPALPPRWTSRVFAAQCVAKIINECGDSEAHLDLSVARQRAAKGAQAEYLVLHLSELIRMGFIAATSESDQLRLEGLTILQLVIDKFAKSPEPEFPGHVILEQYQAQVGAALRPAFAADTASHVTARACEVCSTWIGSGVARDLNDLRRVHQLLVSSLRKLNEASTQGLYNESAATLEKLAILKAWAEVYIVSQTGAAQHKALPLKQRRASDLPAGQPEMQASGVHVTELPDNKSSEENLGNLVAPELQSLPQNWLAALKDHAMLGLPPEFASQLPQSGGAFYSNEAIDNVREYYRQAWGPMLYASALWLSNCPGEDLDTEDLRSAKGTLDNSKVGREDARLAQRSQEDPSAPVNLMTADHFHLLLGTCVCYLCSGACEETQEEVCLLALHTLLPHTLPSAILAANPPLAVEIVSLMHRRVVSCDSAALHQLSVSVVELVIRASLDHLQRMKHQLQQCKGRPANLRDGDADLLAEGGDTGEINPSSSLVFAALQVCLCVMVRHEPSIAPQMVVSAPSLLGPPRCPPPPLVREALLADTVALCALLPNLCSPAGGVAVLPTLMFLTTGMLRACSVSTSCLDTSSPSGGKVGPDRGKSEGTDLARGKNGDSDPARGEADSKDPCRAECVLLTACCRTLAALCSHPYRSDPRSADQWCRLLQTALASTLDCAKICLEEREVSEVAVLRAVTAFVVHSPPCVTAPPTLRYPLLNLYKSAVHHASVQVRLCCCEQLYRIFKETTAPLSAVFIQALLPRLLYQLHKLATEPLDSPATDSPASPAPDSALELRLFHVLLDAILLTFDKTLPKFRCELLHVVVSFLVECSSGSSALCSVALNRLHTLAPLHPQEFREVMTQRPELRARLEAAIKARQSATVAPQPPPPTGISHHTPSIQLKTDFSNFH